MKLRAKLGVNGIEQLIKGVEQYKQNLKKQAALLVDSITAAGVDMCRAEVLRLKIFDTGELYSKVNGYTDLQAGKGFIRVDCDYAVFIEFGTGVPGKSSGYVGTAISKTAYRHMGGTHYVTLPNGRVGWFYPGDDGKMHFTEGQSSRPFMYNTAQQLRDYVRGLS